MTDDKTSQPESLTVTGTVLPTRKLGRPSSYRPEYCEQLLDYFAEVTSTREPRRFVKGESAHQTQYHLAPPPLPTLTGFAVKIGVSLNTLGRWADDYPEFREARARAVTIVEDCLIQDNHSGLLAADSAKWLGNNITTALRDRKEVHTTTDITVSTERVQRLTDDQLATIQRILTEAEPKQLAGPTTTSSDAVLITHEPASETT